ncbi:DMT family transporter [Achromobacter xylosoxidans]|uniref:DMT family transporter n=1 Tax=Alcaligenes xylosoxydans xylosoxydans TaxID=85698 RepID=UPI0003FA881D|nr:DMT family transporter [Achromobacter xylosoxidans]QKQ57360.1 DMT family transporter [Achromobacter xylosoxidans]QPR98080.1 DMT family transporter [Achromobacter xylosoxidans]UON43505.1 DMT family transporter [Achromobacter xylosoxidans]CKH96710.1 putative DMT superfamily transporter inner membrane protein [Achromobacter xylosoxidans]SQG76662.1 putative DMT superfamily transporter inner membrane protein [Achromobacter xylosoxidans]
MFALSRQEIALVLVTMLWGSTFLVIHIAMQHSGPLFFVGVRFTLAGVVSMQLFRRHMARLTRREAGAGVAIGCALFLGYYLQTLGLRTITSSQSAFITALYVPIVPLLQWAVLKRPPGLMSWVGVALAFTGLVLLAGPEAGALHFSAGELATLAGAAAIAAEIILIGHFASSVDSRRVTAVQLLTAGLVSFALMPALGEAVPEFSWLWAGGAIGLGLASAVIQLTMNWAQKSVSPTRATVIYAGEPVWGGIVGRLAGERLPGLALVGAALIVAGVLASEVKFKRRGKPAPGRT